ncbi:type IV secretion system protein VirB11 [Enhydrobacter aerosaccus]|uniref:Type IV secretion system protein n=1 Tax=Enhydrobacter aerosaccus TaxID=225324 RepID=A0A1T4TJ35_9HYPH|nr:P-type DNA transfer ATPase VirB11 [Enhydrobacter aerosaccus]SKA40424.1 type IV secretion system protein VirB11 [Enhydrobacter aerosaccus]
MLDAPPPAITPAQPADSAARALLSLLEPLQPLLAREDVTDIVINRPGEIGIEVRGKWEWIEDDRLTLAKLEAICRGLAAQAKQEINEKLPICSAVLPGGQRVQLLMPPATLPGTISITIRRPPDRVWKLDELRQAGLFHYTRGAEQAGMATWAREDLTDLYRKREWAEFLRLAVLYKQNIVISGATGSGKTSLARALLEGVPPDERIITGEDTHELVGLPQRNKVHLLYPQDKSQAMAQISAKELMTAALRMRPDRIIFPELRDGTAYYFLRSVVSGHPGVITTVHASNVWAALEAMTLLMRECEEAQGLAREDVRSLLEETVDVVVQMERRGGRYEATELLYTRLNNNVVRTNDVGAL